MRRNSSLGDLIFFLLSHTLHYLYILSFPQSVPFKVGHLISLYRVMYCAVFLSYLLLISPAYTKTFGFTLHSCFMRNTSLVHKK